MFSPTQAVGHWPRGTRLISCPVVVTYPLLQLLCLSCGCLLASLCCPPSSPSLSSHLLFAVLYLPFAVLSASLCLPVSFPLLFCQLPFAVLYLPFAVLSASLCFPVSFPLLSCQLPFAFLSTAPCCPDLLLVSKVTTRHLVLATPLLPPRPYQLKKSQCSAIILTQSQFWCIGNLLMLP